MIKQVRRMAEGMQNKLDANSHKGGWIEYDEQGKRFWDKSMVSFLKKKLREEVLELFSYIDNREPPEELKEELFDEACDVANIAMMLADVCGAIPSSKIKR